MQSNDIYDRDYYVGKQAGWSAAGEAMAARLLALFTIRSAVAFGCGTGNWLAALAQSGVGDVLGIDGNPVPRDLLRIAPEQFRAADMMTLAPLDRRFDLAMSLEYAEHLPSSRAEGFVALLTAAAPVVLFSAAVPGQGGLGHVNERRQSWWAALFARHGHVPVDCIRPAIYGMPELDWYYAQNTLIYCAPDHVPAGHAPVRNPLYLDLLDDRVMRGLVEPPDSIGGALRALRRDAGSLGAALRRRVGRR